MDIRNYLDSTYLKTPAQSGLSEEETLKKVYDLVKEAVENGIFAVMIRPEYVKSVKEFLIKQPENQVKIGTVIGFHEGTASVADKLKEAEKAIQDGADELDFVINYEAFKKGNVEVLKFEFLKGTELCLSYQISSLNLLLDFILQKMESLTERQKKVLKLCLIMQAIYL